MNPTKDKVVFAFLTIALFPFLCYLIIRESQNLGTSPEEFVGMVGSLMATLNLTILSGWLAFGWIGGAAIAIISGILVLLLANVYGLPLFYLNILMFFGSFFWGHRLTKRITDLTQLHKVEIEEIEENNNTLAVELQKHNSLNESLKRKLSRFSALKDVTELFSGSLSLDDTISFIVKRAHQLIGKSERTLFYLVDKDTQELALKDSRQPEGFPKIRPKKGDIFDRWVLRQKQPINILDVDKDFRFPQEEVKEKGFGFKSLISYPLIARKRLLALVHMDSRKTDNFSPDDLRLLGIISDLGAVAIENAMLYQRTTELAIRDSLTGLFVHRYFKERLDSELERAYLGNYSLSLLMIDIDHFKGYNDRYGHTAGDILLKTLAGMFGSSVNPGDLIARYGGEEFAIILFEIDKEAARDIAENIRRKVLDEKFWLRREETRISVSIGTATFPVDAKGKSDLINIADQNLYKAKNGGRNRVC